MTVKELWVYPVKSLAGSLVSEIELEERGFKNDRRWMLIDENGRFISQREFPSLTLWKAAVEKDQLILTHLKTEKKIDIPNAKSSNGELIDVQVWNDIFKARLVTVPDQKLLQNSLGFDCRLVYMGADSHRPVELDYAKAGEEVSFADAYPYLIANTVSLKILEERIGIPLDMRRIRPNIVVKGNTPFEEDNWKKINIGRQLFRTPKPCARCVMITIDPETTDKNEKIMAELVGFRKVGRKVLFGMNAIWEKKEEGQFFLKIGDEVVVK